MPDQAKNMLIGIFVVTAFAIIIFVLMFLHPTVGDEGTLLRVRFSNIDKISIGTRVTFAGKPVGEVTAIAELPDAEIERKSTNGYVYVYELTLRVDSSVVVFNTDEISSRTSGLLGEKSVAIIPRPPRKGEELRVVNHEIIYAVESGTVEDAVKEVAVIAGKMETALDGFNDLVAILKENNVIPHIAKTFANTEEITSSLNQNKKEWSDIVHNIHKFSGDLNKTWTSVDQVVHDFSKGAKNFSSVVERIHQGEGTFGRLLAKDDLYMRATALFSKAETTLNDINQYGLLFHLDKGWQRLRARRMNLLQKLSTPQEFRNFFNDEVDMVTTSLERVSMVLEQLEGQPAWCCYDLLQNSDFTKVYSELLRRISALEEEIKMYNEQVVDASIRDNEINNCCY